MQRRRLGLSAPKRWFVGAGIAVLAVGTLVLTTLAFAHVRTVSENDRVAPVPTFGRPADQLTSSPTPPPAETTDAAPTYDRSQERFLVASSSALWRGIAGECGSIEPLLERSVDGGSTWTDVTPRYLGIGQLVSLSSFADGQAEIVASIGRTCEVQALRTFTQGQFWESYPDVLAVSQYVDPTDPARIARPDSSVAAPCADARSMRSTGPVVALVCADLAYVLNGAEWIALSAPQATALAVNTADVVVAHHSDECAGIALTRYIGADAQSPTDAGCVTDAVAEIAAAMAVTASDSVATLWLGDRLATVTQ